MEILGLNVERERESRVLNSLALWYSYMDVSKKLLFCSNIWWREKEIGG